MRYRVVDHSGSQGCDRADGIRPGVERDAFGEMVLVGRLREAIRRLNLSIWDLASGVTWRKCQGTTKIKLISIRLPITKKLLTFDSLVVDEH